MRSSLDDGDHPPAVAGRPSVSRPGDAKAQCLRARSALGHRGSETFQAGWRLFALGNTAPPLRQVGSLAPNLFLA
jgi:hypothetical protein